MKSQKLKNFDQFLAKFSPSWSKNEKKRKIQKSEKIIFQILLKGTTWPNFMFPALAVVSRYSKTYF